MSQRPEPSRTLDGTVFRSVFYLKRGLSIAKLLAEKMGGTITADTLLKPLKQDAVHRCIYMAYLKKRRVHLGGRADYRICRSACTARRRHTAPVGLCPANRQTTAYPLNPGTKRNVPGFVHGRAKC